MKHSLYMVIQNQLADYEKDLKALKLYWEYQNCSQEEEELIEKTLDQSGYPRPLNITYNSEGLPLGVEWKCSSFDPISVGDFLEKEDTNQVDGPRNDHEFNIQLIEAFQDYHMDMRAARLYLECWRLEEDSNWLLEYAKKREGRPSTSEFHSTLHEIVDSFNNSDRKDLVIEALAMKRQSEITEELINMGYPDPHWLIYEDEDGAPIDIDWKCPEFNCQAFYKAIRKEEEDF